VDNTARLCVMNLYLHGIGANGRRRSPIHVDDSLAADPGERFDMVLTNPPFGKKSSVTFVTDEGEVKRESQTIVRDDFWTSTSNKQLNFVQHVKSILKHQRPRGGRRAGQRAVRRRRGRDGAPPAAARVRRAYPAAPADRHLLRPGRQGQRALLRPQARQRNPWTKSCGSTTCAPTRTSPSRPAAAARTWMSSWPATTPPTATTASRPGPRRIRRAAGVLVKPDAPATLLAPALDREHLAGAPNVGTVLSYWDYPSPPGQGWPERLSELLHGMGSLGVEPALSQEIAGQLDVPFKALGLVEELRLVKSPHEVDRLRQSAHYADLGMQKILRAAYAGVSEIEIFSQARSVQMKIIRETDFDPLNTSLLTAAWPARLGTQPHGVPASASGSRPARTSP
jgi:hypothetical protein